MTPEEKNEIYEKAFKHISNPSGDFEVFDKLKSVLDDKISYQIDQIKDYNKPILVIGGYRTLTLGVVSYLWYACTKNQPYNFILPLKHVEFAGLSEDEVKIRLFRNTPSDKINFLDINIDADLVHIVLFNGLLFIEKLNSEYTDIFERLAVIKRNHKGNGVLVVSTEKKGIPASTPRDTLDKQKTSISEAEQGVTTLFYDDAKSILFLEGREPCELTGDEQTLFDYLKNGEQCVENIIKHFCNKKEYSNTNWSRGNFDNLTSDLNKKSLSVFGVRLIKNLERGSGKYVISVKVKDKKFKK